MAIKIVEEGNYLVAKGSPAISNIGYFFGILCFIVGVIMLLAGTLGAVIPGIIGTIFIYSAAHHSKKVRERKIREYREKLVANTLVPVTGECPKCHKSVDAMNAYCPYCGTKLHVYDNTELEETRKNLDAAQKRIEELEREKKGGGIFVDDQK